MSTLVSVRTEESTIEQLDRIAQQMDRNRNWVINEALKNYLELHEWRLEHIRQGISDSEAGRTLTMEELNARIEKRHKAAKAKAR